MKRREVYGTSGPRFVVRLFGGFDYPADICQSEEFVRLGYDLGAPMGGDLRLAPGRAPPAPSFAVWALADVGTGEEPSAPLDRIQIIKGWLDSKGRLHEKVYDVAVGEPYAGAEPASVDPATCELRGAGPKSLCTLWTDPDFDVAERAFYYARVLESPTCRWSQRLCNAGGVRCADRRTIGAGFEGCCDKTHRPLIQERAWTSPIWYSPPVEGAE
jgi:hypothetical protein